MSMGGSSANLPAPSQKTLGLENNRLSTNEEARPIPYFTGWQRLGVTWIDSPRRQKSVPVESAASGGKGAKPSTTGYKYYADMVGLVCLGPVDQITHIWIDQEAVWTGVLVRDLNPANPASTSIDITFPHGRGNMTIFWGRPDQGQLASMAANGHPAYRGQCYVYLPQLHFGQDRTSAPTIELGLRRHPAFDWLPPSNVSDDCNPVATLADVLTHPLYGVNLDSNLIDKPQWQTVANQVADEDAVCSPLLTDGMSMRQFITQLLEYCGGYLRWTNDSKLQIGLMRDAPADLTTLPQVTASHLIDPPEIETIEWSDTFNRTILKCLERERGWKEDYGQWFDQGNFAITGQTRAQNLERRWITRRSVATKMAQRLGKLAAIPQFTGSLRLRASAADNLSIGSWFVLDWTGWNFALVLQVTSRRIGTDATPEVEIEVTGQQVSEDPALLYDPDDVINHDPADPEVEQLAQWRMIELPKALAKDTSDPVIAPLAVRGGAATIMAHVLDSQDGASYDFLEDVSKFAIGGTLAAAYPAVTDPLDLSVGMLVNLAGPDQSLPGQSDIAMKNAKLLVFVGDEILSVRTFSYVGAGQVRIFAKRGKFDTGQLAHGAGEQVYIIKKRNLTAMRADAFTEVGQQVLFKLQPCSLGQQFDLSLLAPQTLTIVGRALMPQPFASLIINGTPALAGRNTRTAAGWSSPGR